MTSERRNKHKPGQIVAKLRDATASVVMGRNSNGRIEWKAADGRSLKGI